MSELEQLEQAIATLETQRAILGDVVIETLLAPARAKVAALKVQSSPFAQQRKHVTILFADVSGFTAMTEALDAEEATEVINALWQRLDTAITAHGGKIDKHIGDAVMALWGVHVSREDDPAQAIRAAIAMQMELAVFRATSSILATSVTVSQSIAGLRMRIGVNTGPVLLGTVGTTAEFTAIGDAVNLASRLEHAAPVDGILIAHATYRHVRGLFDVQVLDPLSVKGKSAPVQAYSVERARTRSFRMVRQGVEGVESRLIGRDTELMRLQKAFEEVISNGELQVVTVVGEAGIGKSRLLSEFEQWLDNGPQRVWYFKGRADEGMSQLPYSLIRDLLAFRFEIHDSDPLEVARHKLEQGMLDFILPTLSGGADVSPADVTSAMEQSHFIGHLLGWDFSTSPHLVASLNDAAQIRQRAFYYLTLFLRAVIQSRLSEEGQAQPAVILLEDIHWADEASLDLVDYLARELRSTPGIPGRERGVPLLIVGLARETLFEYRPGWGEGQTYHTRLNLQALTEDDSSALMDEILNKLASIPSPLRDTVVMGAKGNPFYVEELIKTLVEAGAIVTQEDPWRVDLTRLETMRVPPTLTGVLQARLDRLGSAEHATLKRASVVGQIFWQTALATLMADHGRATTTIGIDQLDGLALEASLNNLQRRAMIMGHAHSQFADTPEYAFKHAILRDVAYESVLLRERRPWHAMTAHWLIEQSGERADEYAGLIASHYERAGVGLDAASWYYRAGRQAQGVYANGEAIRLYEKALALGQIERHALPLSDQIDILLRLGKVRQLIGEWRTSGQRFCQALALAEQAHDTLAQALCHQAIATLLDAQGDYVAALGWFERARVGYADHGDQARLSQVVEQIGSLYWSQGDFQRGQTTLEEALELARQTGDQRGMAWAINDLGALAAQLNDWTTARALLEESLVLKQAIGDKSDIATSLNNVGYTVAHLGDYQAATALLEESLALSRQIGDKAGIRRTLASLAEVSLMISDRGRAQILYQQALIIAYELGAKPSIALYIAGLASVAAQAGQVKRATRLAGAVSSLLDKFDLILDPIEQDDYERGVATARSQMDTAAFDKAWSEGQAMTVEDAIRYALEESIEE